jgi:hypothetical protein
MHVNEQEPAYWARIFLQHGYHRYDCIRPLLSGSRKVEPWYRYNTFLYANGAGEERVARSARLYRVPPGGKAQVFEDFSWTLRRAVLRRLPRPAVDFLSRLNYRFQTRSRAAAHRL